MGPVRVAIDPTLIEFDETPWLLLEEDPPLELVEEPLEPPELPEPELEVVGFDEPPLVAAPASGLPAAVSNRAAPIADSDKSRTGTECLRTGTPLFMFVADQPRSERWSL
jgi:hypothetical protein